MEGLLHIILKVLMQEYGCFHTEDKESLGKELVSAVVWLMWPKKWEDGRSNDIQSQPIGLVFLVPHRHDKPKQSTCLFYQSTKNHAKKTRSKNNRQPRNDGNTRGHLKKITGVNSNKWYKYKRNRKYNTRTREHIARNYIKIMCTYAPEDKEWFTKQLTRFSDKDSFVGLKFSQPKIPKILMSSNRQKNFDGMFRIEF